MNFVFPEDLPTASEAVNSILKGKNVFNIKIALVTKKVRPKTLILAQLLKENLLLVREKSSVETV